MNKNILFFFDTNVDKEGKLTKVKKYINELDKNADTFEGNYHYITAAAKAVQDTLLKTGSEIHSVLCASDDLQDKNKEYFEMEFKKIINDNVKLIWAKYSKENSSQDILNSIHNSTLQSQNEFFEKGDTLYIITNGGIRKNVMFFSTFTQILKDRGLTTNLVYVELPPRSSDDPERVINVTEGNKYFDVLRAVELFTQSGNPKGLKDIYENDVKLAKLLGYMEQFYKSIQICKPVNNGIVQIYQDMCDEIDNLIEKDKDIDVIIKLLLPTIKSKFMPLGTDYNEPFLQILQWCYENDLVLIGFFILDAEYKWYLYKTKEIIQFKGFDLNGKKIYLPSKETAENRIDQRIEDPNGKIKANNDKIKANNKNKYKGGIEAIRKNENNIYGYNECLTVIFQELVYNLQSQSYNLSKEIKDYLTSWEVILYDDDEKNQKLYELILLQDFIRKLRNNMAHSGNVSITNNKTNIIGFIKAYFSDNLFNKKYKSKDNNDIDFNDLKIYDKLKVILETSLNIIKNNIKSLSEEKPNESKT